jgi:hypothetical protein
MNSELGTQHSAPSNQNSELNPKKSSRRRFQLSRFYHENQEPIKLWLIWRIALLVLGLFTAILAPRGPASPITFYNFGDLVRERTIWGWTHWDGEWYADIAARGYWREVNDAFYPLYPFLMRGLGFIMSAGQTSIEVFKLAGLLISSGAALAVCVLLYKLARLEYDEEIARHSVAYLLAFPTALFLAAVYTESLYLALAIGAFYAARTNRWLLALALAALTILTQSQGVFIALALLVEYGHQREWNWRKLDRQILYFGLPVLAGLGWLAWNMINFNNATSFITASQKYFLHYLSWPWQTMQDAFQRFYILNEDGARPAISYQPDSVPMLDLACTISFMALALVAVWATTKGRLRPAYLVLFLFSLIQPLFLPAEWSILAAMPRYVLVIFPAFFLLALGGRRWNFFQNSYFIIGLSVAGLLVARFTLGYWVA